MPIKKEMEILIEKMLNAENLSKKELQELLSELNVKISTLHHIATHDEKTGLRNFSFFKEIFAIESAQAVGGRQLCLIITDIDFFKRINDSQGHIFADNLLKKLGALISKELKPYEVLARFGGDELVILLPGSSIDEAVAVAERIRKVVSEDVTMLQNQITMSLGVSCFKEKETLNELIDRADKALYKAKAEGRNKVCAG